MFEKCTSKKEIESLFRRLAKYLHPDVGGEQDLFIRLMDSRDHHLHVLTVVLKNKEEPKKQKQYYKYTFEDVCKTDENLNSLLREIAEYATNNKKFDTRFCDSVVEYLEKKGYVTSSQYNALVNIYYQYRMDKNKK